MAKRKKLIQNMPAIFAILSTSVIFPSSLFLATFVKGLKEQLSISISHPVSWWLTSFLCLFAIMLFLFYLQLIFYKNKLAILAICALALPFYRLIVAVIDWFKSGLYNPFTELISLYPNELYLLLVIAFLNIAGYRAFSFIHKN